MKAERQYKEVTSRVLHLSKSNDGFVVDNRPQTINRTKFIKSIQKMDNAIQRQTYVIQRQLTLGVLPECLTNGMAEAANKPEMLFSNMCNENFPFLYTGSGVSLEDALAGRGGDCSTLAQLFVDILKLYGCMDCEIIGRPGKVLVPGCNIKGKSITTNTEPGNYWLFFEHWWAKANGVEYDLLFMKKRMEVEEFLDPEEILYEKKVYYYKFDQNHYAVTQFGNPNLTFPNIQSVGAVFDNLGETILFISEHLIEEPEEFSDFDDDESETQEE